MTPAISCRMVISLMRPTRKSRALYSTFYTEHLDPACFNAAQIAVSARIIGRD
jgi:hypothetical protein